MRRYIVQETVMILHKLLDWHYAYYSLMGTG